MTFGNEFESSAKHNLIAYISLVYCGKPLGVFGMIPFLKFIFYNLTSDQALVIMTTALNKRLSFD